MTLCSIVVASVPESVRCLPACPQYICFWAPFLFCLGSGNLADAVEDGRSAETEGEGRGALWGRRRGPTPNFDSSQSSYCASRCLECCLSLGAPLSYSRWIRLELPVPQPWLFVSP